MPQELYIPDQPTAGSIMAVSTPLTQGWGQVELVHAAIDNVSPEVARRGEHSHDVFHCVVVKSGRGSYPINGQSVAVNGPHLFLISPWIPHAFARAPGDTTIYGEATFRFTDLPEGADWNMLLSELSGMPVSVPVEQPLSSLDAAVFTTVFSNIVTGGRAAGHAAGAMLGLELQALWHAVFRVCVRERSVPDSDDWLQRARQFIEQDSDAACNLAAIAEVAGRGTRQLVRAFRERFGQTPMQYRRTLLMHRAAVLLLVSEQSLVDIAEQLGFDDIHYFNRTFKQHHGIPPGKYRKQARGDG